MNWWRKLFLIGTIVTLSVAGSYSQYTASWESLDTRPLPEWYDEAKFGIFIHWGVFSVPSFGSEWFWYSWKHNSAKFVEFMENNYPPNFTYQDFARDFTAEFFNPEDWADIFQSSGAKYVVLTSKHCEGYTLWPSSTSFGWNAMDVGPKRDLVGDLAYAIRSKTDLKFGLYHSLYEWYNPLYLQDQANNYTTQVFVNQKTMPELYDLVEKYEPEVIWSDGEWEASDDYWKSKEFIAWLYNESPVSETVVVNDRWGTDDLGKHGDFYTYSDRFNPGYLLEHKWENCMTIDSPSWGFRRNAKLSDYLTMDTLIQTLAETVSCGGNLLMNVGPSKEGIIMPIYEERLRGMGNWLNINGEAIYSSKPWTYQNDTLASPKMNVWYTKNATDQTTVYAIVLDWPTDNNSLTLGAPKFTVETSVTLLGHDQSLVWKAADNGIQITFPNKAEVTSEWAWGLKLTNIQNYSYDNTGQHDFCLQEVMKYEPTWESLDSRPLPQWYDDAKFGIFIHWGVFSVPSFGSEWLAFRLIFHSTNYVDFMKKNYPPNFTYQDFARDFTAEFYDPEEWAEIFKNSGAKYVVLTSKHHEGYTLWPSETAFSWNAMDVGPNRDLLGDLAKAIRAKTDIKFGLYHSLYEWFNPLYLYDKNNGFKTQLFVKQKTMPELYELVEKYKPEVIWSDGEWEAFDTYWTSKEFIAWLYNESPVKDTVVVNDRWGTGDLGKHGDFYTYADRYNPGVLKSHKWENCMTIDKDSWGFRRNAKLSDYLTVKELVTTLAETVSCGGNLLMNVGPTKDGIIAPIYQERLREIGKWLSINGEAIYSSRPWTHQNDTVTSGVWYTKKEENEKIVYAIVLNWPPGGKLKLGAPQLLMNSSAIYMLGHNQDLQWTTSEGLKVQFPNKADVTSQWAWVLKMTHV
ncbi:hypothetical protein L9F63_015603, partial [Diploptera punctata]